MFPFPNVQVGRGISSGPFTVRGRWWTQLTANFTTPTQIEYGRLCVADITQAGAAALTSSGTTTTRSSAGSTPNYDTAGGDNDLLANWVLPATLAAGRIMAGIYVGSRVLTNGQVGEFAVAGRVRNVLAWGNVSGGGTPTAIAIGDPLTFSISYTSSAATDPYNLGRLVKASSGEYPLGIALSALGSGSRGTIDVLMFGYPFQGKV